MKIDRAFAIFVDQDYDFLSQDSPGKQQWTAHIVGFELDNMTCHDTPENAVYMAHDLLCAMTDAPIFGHAEINKAMDIIKDFNDPKTAEVMEILDRLVNPSHYDDDAP